MYRNGDIRELVAAGMSCDQAEAIVQAIERIASAQTEPLASRTEMREDLITVSRVLQQSLVASRRRTVCWILALHTLLIAILVGIARFTDLLC